MAASSSFVVFPSPPPLSGVAASEGVKGTSSACLLASAGPRRSGRNRPRAALRKERFSLAQKFFGRQQLSDLVPLPLPPSRLTPSAGPYDGTPQAVMPTEQLFPKSKTVGPARRIGVLGGGQLARMMSYAAHRLNIELHVLDPDPTAPGGQVADRHIVGSFRDPAKIRELAAGCDMITTEIEHVDTAAMAELEASGVRVQPSAAAIGTVQDKFAQKRFLQHHAVPIGEFVETPDKAAVLRAGQELGYPMLLKSKRMAYDGKGNALVRSPEDVDDAIAKLGASAESRRVTRKGKSELYAEKFVPFVKEVAVMVARGTDGSLASHPVVETVQEDNVCRWVICPAELPPAVAREAQRVAEAAVAAFDGAGIYGVELFVLPDGQVLFNEIAPRPHNSGHLTIEACVTDQFEQHLRAVAGLPLGDPAMKVGAAVMLNILGARGDTVDTEPLNRAMSTPGVAMHWYGKRDARSGRKMGHLTVVGPTMEEVRRRIRAMGIEPPAPNPLVPSSSAAASSSAGPVPAVAPQAAPAAPAGRPLVGIIMGSDSDLPRMKPAAEILTEFGVPFELTVVSAHRTPKRMMEYAASAHERGLRCIIAGAGGAAHLPGMVASMTPLPVVGVPCRTSGPLDGVDALHSIVQMPKGVPVATVGIDNAANAGLLAVRIVASSDRALLDRMAAYQRDMEQMVLDKADKLEREGWQNYGTPAAGLGFKM
eukprot:tig00001181_g7444.t1